RDVAVQDGTVLDDEPRDADGPGCGAGAGDQQPLANIGLALEGPPDRHVASFEPGLGASVPLDRDVPTERGLALERPTHLEVAVVDQPADQLVPRSEVDDGALVSPRTPAACLRRDLLAGGGLGLPAQSPLQLLQLRGE